MKVLFAKWFAIFVHWKAGNKRRYTNESYSVHLEQVVSYLLQAGITDKVTLAAAWLHDVVEDAGIKLSTIRFLFGNEIADVVDELTEKARKEDGKRSVRVAMEVARLASVSCTAQTIKYADIASNLSRLAQDDFKFCKVYVTEKEAAVSMMTRGHRTLRDFVISRIESVQYDLRVKEASRAAPSLSKA